MYVNVLIMCCKEICQHLKKKKLVFPAMRIQKLYASTWKTDENRWCRHLRVERDRGAAVFLFSQQSLGADVQNACCVLAWVRIDRLLYFIIKLNDFIIKNQCKEHSSLSCCLTSSTLQCNNTAPLFLCPLHESSRADCLTGTYIISCSSAYIIVLGWKAIAC